MRHDLRWTSDKIRQRLRLIEPLVYRSRRPLQPFRYFELSGPQAKPPVALDVDDDDWPVIPWATHWSAPDTNFVLRSWFHLPRNWGKEGPIALHLLLGDAGEFCHPEALVYIDGQPLAACDRYHQEIPFPQHLSDGTKHLLALHGWTGGRPALHHAADGRTSTDPAFPLLMGTCSLVCVHQGTRDLVALARVALGVADCLNEDQPARAHLYNALDEAFRILDTREPFEERFYASVPQAYQTLAAAIARSGPPLDVHVTAVGHAHIDLAWLWTVDQARRKAGRTFHSVLRLMDQDPSFRFTQSQAQLYDFVRQDYPQLFASIKERIDEGRWEPIGGMWVEADCNLSGGEALARQLLLGQTFFRQHFGPRGWTSVLWLPDVFGYAGNLPQLIKQAGLEYFFTIKIGWSEYNRFPYDSFWWQGLDGTRILTHFSPTKHEGSPFASTYNSAASPDEVLSTWTNFQQKDWGKPGQAPPLLLCYGHGDGGGGPTREMLENLGALRSFPGMPQVEFGTAADFFSELEATAGEALPIWNGELYLEYHRGTYTTQARTKRANRKAEFLLHDVEFLAALAHTLGPDSSYPHEALRKAWELVCLNQFHDIIPGSSIKEVYTESLKQHAHVEEMGQALKQAALQAISNHIEGDFLVVNPTSFLRQDLALWPGGKLNHRSLQLANDQPVGAQETEVGLLLDVGELPPYSVTPLYLASSLPAQSLESASNLVNVTPGLLENGFLRVELNTDGDITRICDKELEREVLPPRTIANQFQAFEDRPRNWDAWDIDAFYDDRTWLAEPAESVRVVETGPLRATLEVQRRILNSEVCQRISLAHHSRRLDFATTIHWNERHIMLKVAFPVDILAPRATYEIQWGNVQRPTHCNTSWDWARFETCAHKWVDLSEGGYGVSLLNDCKYGHDIHENVMRLTLLRSPADPDPEADLGEHQVTYSLLPHPGTWNELTVAQAYALNDPLIVWQRETGAPRVVHHKPNSLAFLAVDRPNVVIETVKQAEDGNGLIVRLYESQRCRCSFRLTTSFPLAGAWQTNLLEEDERPLSIEEQSLRFAIKPYQIVTLRLLPRQHDSA
jgi:alpha-mannosidase